jgi:hypothetical protein
MNPVLHAMVDIDITKIVSDASTSLAPAELGAE